MTNEQKRPYRVLLALEERTEQNEAHRAEVTRLIRVGRALARAQQADSLTVLGLVPVGEGQSLSEGAMPAQNQRTMLGQLVAATEQAEEVARLEVKTSVRVSNIRELSQELNDAILEHQIDLLLLEARWFDEPRLRHTDQAGETHAPLEDMMRRPLCDLAIIGPGVDIEQSQRVLLAARGGPFSELGLSLASGVADQTQGEVTVLHVVRQDADGDGLDDTVDDSGYADLMREMAGRSRIRRRQVVASNPQEAIVREAQQGYNLVILGATMSTSLRIGPTRTEALLQNPFGPVAQAVMDQTRATDTVEKGAENEQPRSGPGVIIVRTGAPRDFYFARLRRKQEAQARLAIASEDAISRLVDKWFAENTFDAEEYGDIERLIHSKKSQGLTISLGLPALNEEKTIGDVISVIKKELFDKYPLLDEIVVIDSQSSDRTVEIAKELGVPVHIHQKVLPSISPRRGKGEALWKSMYVLKGDIICWVDTDITNMDPRFVYGLVGPLLKEPRIQYVKGYYRRPIRVGDKIYETGGGRVTELTIRPLFNLFFPELSGMIQPLAGEYAGRRTCLEQLPFFTGYGVETGHLIDVLERFGLNALGQVNLRERQHRNQELGALSQMAFAITQVVIKRLEERERLRLTEDVNRTMKLITLGEEGLRLSVRHIEDRERPPMLEIPEYRQKYRQRLLRAE